MLKGGALLVLVGSVGLSLASELPRLPAIAIAKPPVIDGKIEAEEWQGAATAKGFIDSTTGKPVADDTEIYLAYDHLAIYVGFYARDSKPEGIVGREIKPGSEFDGEDVFGFVINPQGTGTWDGRCVFRINSLNTQNEDISGGRAAKREWRGEWTSAVQRQLDGWSAEMRIPWKMLNYPAGQRLKMNINFKRFQPRTNIESKWADTTTQDRQELNGLWTDVSPPRAPRPRPSFLGYLAPEYDRRRVGLRSGLDVRYPFTSQLTGLLSINPDFKNIESEIAGIEFSRTERYLDEARPFFNEGGDFFEVGGFPFGFGQMFYSRRIEEMDWGAKSFGQITPSLSVGALTAVESGQQTSNVIRVSNNFAPRRYANAWFTGVTRDSYSSDAYGFSGAYGLGNYNAYLNVATSRDLGDGSPTAGDTSIDYSVPHWFVLLKYQWIPPSFSSPLAYIPWVDRQGTYLFAEHSMEYRSGPLKEFYASAFGSYYEDYRGGQRQKGAEAEVSVTTRSDIGIEAYIGRFSYYGERDSIQNVSVTFNESNRYKRFSIYHEWGLRANEPSKYTSLDVSYRLMRGLDLGLSWSLLNLDGEDRLTVGTLSYEFGPYDSVSGRFVNRNGDTNAYVAYRHGGGKGIEYYVIIGDPNAEKWRSRVSLKVVFAF